jgi:hypothetical protein
MHHLYTTRYSTYLRICVGLHPPTPVDKDSVCVLYVLYNIFLNVKRNVLSYISIRSYRPSKGVHLSGKDVRCMICYKQQNK